MEFNKKMITSHIAQYKQIYIDKFGVKPTSAFTYLKWLGNSTNAGNFDVECMDLAKKLLEDM